MKNRLKLLQLLQDNKHEFTPIERRIVAKDRQASIYLYDPIVSDRITAEYWGGICPQDFVPAMRALEADEITIYTNCPGGDIFAAEAMCQSIREHSAKVTMQIEGYAASAATSIACACDEVVATSASKYMIHQAWTLAMGNADDMDEVAALLRKCDESMYAEYEQRSGQKRDQIVQWCKAETWFTAAEAMSAGFIDRVLEAKASAKNLRAYNLAAYDKAPPPPEPEPEPQDTTTYITEEHRARQKQRVNLLSRI